MLNWIHLTLQVIWEPELIDLEFMLLLELINALAVDGFGKLGIAAIGAWEGLFIIISPDELLIVLFNEWTYVFDPEKPLSLKSMD